MVAINKCDLPDANPRMMRQRLMEHGLVAEEFGGEVLARRRLRHEGHRARQAARGARAAGRAARAARRSDAARARASCSRRELDRGRGPVATVLVQDGTLRRGDVVVVGTALRPRARR